MLFFKIVKNLEQEKIHFVKNCVTNLIQIIFFIFSLFSTVCLSEFRITFKNKAYLFTHILSTGQG